MSVFQPWKYLPRPTAEQLYAACEQVHAEGKYPSYPRVMAIFQHQQLYLAYQVFRQIMPCWAEERGVRLMAKRGEPLYPDCGHYGPRLDGPKPALPQPAVVVKDKPPLTMTQLAVREHRARMKSLGIA